MFGFLKSVTDDSDSEASVHHFDRDFENDFNQNASRAEIRVRNNRAGRSTIRRVQNMYALSDTDVSSDEEEDRLVDIEWKNYFAMVDSDTFWEDNYVPTLHHFDNTPKPQGLKGEVEKKSSLVKNNQRLLDRQLRRKYHQERRNLAVLRISQHKQANAAIPETLEQEDDDVINSKPKSKARVKFGYVEESNNQTTSIKHSSDDDEDNLVGCITETEIEDALTELSENENILDDTSDLCPYCVHNPYRKFQVNKTGDKCPSRNLAIIENIDLLTHSVSKSKYSLLRKSATTNFANGLESLLYAVKMGLDISVGIEYYSDKNTVHVPYSHFKVFSDKVELVQDQFVTMSTIYGTCVGVRDKYALSILLALCQFHYLNAKIQPKSTKKLGKVFITKDGESVGTVSPHEDQTLGAFNDSDFPYVLYIYGNTGCCTCEGKPVRRLPYNDDHRIDLGVVEICHLDKQDFTYVLPHKFTAHGLINRSTA